MPTIGLKKHILDHALGKVYSQDELEAQFFDFGLELDDVVVEKNEAGKEEETYKIEVPANRYDLLCVEGLARALRIFNKGDKVPQYTLTKPKSPIVLKVDASTKGIRDYVVAAVLRDVTLDQNAYNSFIDLQDKLHQNICRKRTLVSVGTHDLDTVQPPFAYVAREPSAIRFVPLNKKKEYSAHELMDLYSSDLQLREYLPIIRDKPRYPLIIDANNVVCSLPPIINSEHSKITLKTRNIFIEATATDLRKAEIVLDSIVTMFGEHCKQKFSVEPVEVKYDDGRAGTGVYPKLTYRKQPVNVPSMSKKIGVNLTAERMAELLTRMCLGAKIVNKNTLEVTVPPTRHDILHECDVAEDVALAYGYGNIVPRLPQAHTVAQPLALNKLTDQLRAECAFAGWTEVLNFALCSTEDVSTKLRKANAAAAAVKIANPKTAEFQVVRTSLMPGLLKTLSNNKDMPLPLKLFEVQDVVFKDESRDTKTRNQRNTAAIYYNKTSSFEVIHGLLDRIMEALGVACSKRDPNAYYIRSFEDETYFPGRAAEIVFRASDGTEQSAGNFGVLHPEVLTQFALPNPVCALELNVELFL